MRTDRRPQLHRGLGWTGILLASGAVAQTSGPAPADAHAQSITLHIPAEPLVRALRDFATQSHLQVVYETELLRGTDYSPGLNGTYNVRLALDRMLDNTRFRYDFLNSNTVSITLEAPPVRQEGDHVSPLLMVSGLAQPSADVTSDGPSSGSSEQTLAQASPVQLEEVTVTGTHISGAIPSSPIISLDAIAIQQTGLTTIGDVLRSIPENFSGGASPQTQTFAGPFSSNGTGGNSSGSAPNLRGLGNSSTLTLVDGHRLAQDVQTGAVDASLIPLAAIDRIEVLTDGASAVYGSDAVAGVVNILLKKNFDGAETLASSGVATEGGGFDYRIGQTLGRSWSTGGALLVYEHDRQDSVSAEDRSFTSTVTGPYSLLPDMTRDSLYVSAHQRFGRISAFVDGVYASRDTEAQLNYPPTYDLHSPSIRSYLGSGGLSAVLFGDWETKLIASWGEQSSDLYTYVIPGYTPHSTEALVGKTRTVELNLNGSVLTLPSGPLRGALGFGERQEDYSDQTPFGRSVAEGQRRIRYVFGELAIPLAPPSERPGLRRLDLSLSGRYERYSDFGGKAVPKLGIVYSPVEELVTRASVSKSFRAPTFVDLYQLHSAYLDTVPDPKSPGGSSTILELAGGNPNLHPETATSTTAGFEWKPRWLNGVKLAANVFHIDYKNRIGSIEDYYTALSEPANEGFVTRNPSIPLQNALLAIAGPERFYNFTAGPYDPAAVAAFVDERNLNVGRVRVFGYDLTLNDITDLPLGTLSSFLNATYLDLGQQVTPQSPETQLAGNAFSPPHVRARGGATWSVGHITASGFVNYIGRETNTYQPTHPAVASWTTIDTQLAYESDKGRGVLSGLRASLSVQNILNRDPPFLDNPFGVSGLNYDNTNASPLGRFVSLQITKSWW